MGLVRLFGSSLGETHMPKILLKEKQLTSQFRCTVDNQTLASLDNAVAAARKAGLVVEYRTDVEALMRRLTKVIKEETAKQSESMVMINQG